jgi:hypothetical protein
MIFLTGKIGRNTWVADTAKISIPADIFHFPINNFNPDPNGIECTLDAER